MLVLVFSISPVARSLLHNKKASRKRRTTDPKIISSLDSLLMNSFERLQHEELVGYVTYPWGDLPLTPDPGGLQIK